MLTLTTLDVELLPIAVVIPTRNRAAALRRTLESLAAQSHQPAELIIVDASDLAGAVVAATNPRPSLAAAGHHQHRRMETGPTLPLHEK